MRYLFLVFALIALPAHAQTISGLSYAVTDTTIVGTWTTSPASNSNITCGAKNGIDNGVAANSTSNQAIVTGLSPSTLYSCTVTSGSTTSSPQNVTTSAAAVRTPITSLNVGPPTTTTVHGDTIYNFVSSDNSTYNTMDDGYGWTTPNAGANMQIDKLTNESTFQGSTVNLLTAYGGFATSNGTDGPSGSAQTNKLSGIFGFSGDLFLFAGRGEYCGTGHVNQNAWYGNIMLSQNHGTTWNSWQAPATFSASGIPPSPLGSYQMPVSTWGWIEPVRYAVDDGTMGYLTAGNQIDGANGFVYITTTDGWWNNGSNLYLMRIPRIQMLAQNGSAIQVWVGPSSPTPAQFVNDSNWSSSAASPTAIYSAPGQVSSQDLIFIPAMNYYLLLEWYQPAPSCTVTNDSVWVISAGPTPAGPWTQIKTQTNNPSGYYNPVVMHRTAATNTSLHNVALTIVYGGDYNNQSVYYYPAYSQMTLNPTAQLSNVTLSNGASIQ